MPKAKKSKKPQAQKRTRKSHHFIQIKIDQSRKVNSRNGVPRHTSSRTHSVIPIYAPVSMMHHPQNYHAPLRENKDSLDEVATNLLHQRKAKTTTPTSTKRSITFHEGGSGVKFNSSGEDSDG